MRWCRESSQHRDIDPRIGERVTKGGVDSGEDGEPGLFHRCLRRFGLSLPDHTRANICCQLLAHLKELALGVSSQNSAVLPHDRLDRTDIRATREDHSAHRIAFCGSSFHGCGQDRYVGLVAAIQLFIGQWHGVTTLRYRSGMGRLDQAAPWPLLRRTRRYSTRVTSRRICQSPGDPTS